MKFSDWKIQKCIYKFLCGETAEEAQSKQAFDSCLVRCCLVRSSIYLLNSKFHKVTLMSEWGNTREKKKILGEKKGKGLARF